MSQDEGNSSMTLDLYFRGTRKRLLKDMGRFLSAKKKGMARLRPWGSDVIRRLRRFAGNGKLIRGCLVCLGHEMAGRRVGRAAVRPGTALEFIQSALLIHDDSMDQDAMRRGEPSIHEQYARLARAGARASASHLGISMGICAGEIAIFLAFEALAGLSAPRGRAAEVQGLFASEFGLVGLGQMLDIQAGASGLWLSEREILDLYRYKTARYSFSLPLLAGWILAGGKRSAHESLWRLGEALGLVFQLKDDEIGLFGDERVTGKPVGSDIRQGKKTFLYHRLLGRATAGERKGLSAVFGRPDASAKDILLVRRLAERHGVASDIRRTMEKYSRQARRLINGLPVEPKCREVLESFLDYNLTRKS